MLCLDQNKRIGAGPPSEGLDFAALKSHPFFKDMDIDTLEYQESPLLAVYESLIAREHDDFDDLPDDLFTSDEYQADVENFGLMVQSIVQAPLHTVKEAENEACSMESYNVLRLGNKLLQPERRPCDNESLESIEEEKKLHNKRHLSNVTADDEPAENHRHTVISQESEEDEKFQNDRRMSKSTMKVPMLELSDDDDSRPSSAKRLPLPRSRSST